MGLILFRQRWLHVNEYFSRTKTGVNPAEHFEVWLLSGEKEIDFALIDRLIVKLCHNLFAHLFLFLLMLDHRVSPLLLEKIVIQSLHCTPNLVCFLHESSAKKDYYSGWRSKNTSKFFKDSLLLVLALRVLFYGKLDSLFLISRMTLEWFVWLPFTFLELLFLKLLLMHFLHRDSLLNVLLDFLFSEILRELFAW